MMRAMTPPHGRDRIAVLNQGYIPHYRRRFFELLAEHGEADYVVFHGAPPSWVGVEAATGPFAFAQRWVENREIRIGPWTAIYQPVLREILGGGYDAVVLGADLKFVSSVLLAVLARLRGIAVLYWDFGYHPKRGFGHGTNANESVMAVARRIKNALARSSDGYLAYTNAGAERLAEIGYQRERIFVLQNTIDMTEQLRLHDAVQGQSPRDIRAKLGLQPDSVVFVYIGRLVEFKRVDLLIEAVRRIARDRNTAHPVEALIIGGGPLEQPLRDIAADVPGVHFLGALPAGEEVARCFKIAAAAVIPGAVGLAVNHAFAHGKPMITGANELHGPEIEYIVDGENGLVVRGGAEQFAAVLAQIADSPNEQARLAQGALKARQGLRMESMVEQFDTGVRATLERRRHGRGGKRAAVSADPA
jgi:glycosyltransferase involved in cell wall biosynthesis